MVGHSKIATKRAATEVSMAQSLNRSPGAPKETESDWHGVTDPTAMSQNRSLRAWVRRPASHRGRGGTQPFLARVVPTPRCTWQDAVSCVGEIDLRTQGICNSMRRSGAQRPEHSRVRRYSHRFCPARYKWQRQDRPSEWYYAASAGRVIDKRRASRAPTCPVAVSCANRPIAPLLVRLRRFSFRPESLHAD